MNNSGRRSSLVKIIELTSPRNLAYESDIKSTTPNESFKVRKNVMSISRGSNGARSPRSSISRGSRRSPGSPGSHGSSLSPRYFDRNSKVLKLKCLGYNTHKPDNLKYIHPARNETAPKRKYTRFREQIKLALAKYSHSSYVHEFSGRNQNVRLDDLWSIHTKPLEPPVDNTIRLKRRAGSIPMIQRSSLDPNEFKKLTIKGNSKEISTVIDHYKRSNAFMNSTINNSKQRTPVISTKKPLNVRKPKTDLHDFDTVSSEEPSFCIKSRYVN